MNRNTRLLVVVGIAVVVAALASLGVYVALVRRRPPPPTTYVVVAAKPLEIGLGLTKDHVKRIAWPPGNPLAGSFDKVESVVNRGLVAPVAENEPITESKLAPGAGMWSTIKSGMRAMSVRVNDVIGVAGFVVPGTKVDVLVTVRLSETNRRTCLVVGDVQVLTAGTRYDESNAKKEAKAIPSAVVTLMVKPDEAKRIALATTQGQIMLALRNPLDRGVTQANCSETAELIGVQLGPAPQAPRRERADTRPRPAQPREPERPPQPKVVTIKGGVEKTVVLQ